MMIMLLHLMMQFGEFGIYLICLNKELCIYVYINVCKMDLFKYNSLINAKFLIFYRGMMRDFYIYLKNITYFLS